jgi:hypothetical protein
MNSVSVLTSYYVESYIEQGLKQTNAHSPSSEIDMEGVISLGSFTVCILSYVQCSVFSLLSAYSA